MTRICIFAPNEEEAKRWANSQNLEKDQYFYPHSTGELMFESNFHVIVIGIGNLSSTLFEQAYNLALKRGKIGRE